MQLLFVYASFDLENVIAPLEKLDKRQFGFQFLKLGGGQLCWCRGAFAVCDYVLEAFLDNTSEQTADRASEVSSWWENAVLWRRNVYLQV